MNQTEMQRGSSAGIVPNTVYRLIYRSRSLVPADKRDEELGAILRTARPNNAALGITGALLMYEAWFAQTLEGDEGAVRELYAKISADKRHDTVTLQEEGVVGARVFSRWAMAMVGEHGEADIPIMATSSGISQAAARSSTPEQERVLTMMRDITRGYGRGS